MKNYRKNKAYKEMTIASACSMLIIEHQKWYENYYKIDIENLKMTAWQWLYDTNEYLQLGDWWRLSVAQNLRENLIQKKKRRKVKDYRRTKFYKSLDTYLACAFVEGFCEGEGATDVEIMTAWQYIRDNKLYLQLQGWYGRTVQGLLEGGYIK